MPAVPSGPGTCLRGDRFSSFASSKCMKPLSQLLSPALIRKHIIFTMFSDRFHHSPDSGSSRCKFLAHSEWNKGLVCEHFLHTPVIAPYDFSFLTPLSTEMQQAHCPSVFPIVVACNYHLHPGGRDLSQSLPFSLSQ